MFTCYLQGGLGNQLFQIFTTIAYAQRFKIPFGFLYKVILSANRPTYWDTFLLPLKFFTKIKLPKMTVIKEKGFNYHVLPPPNSITGEDIELHGYFQSYKYFELFFPQICRIIRFDQQKQKIINEYPTLLNYYSNLVGMHFRLGDYKQLQDYHPILPLTYYKNSIQHIITETGDDFLSILYFCELDDIEMLQETVILPLQQLFPSCKFINAQDYVVEDWKQMVMMSCCNHNIIANSTFSWWSAYFNFATYSSLPFSSSTMQVKSEPIICYPALWFGQKLVETHNTEDMFPPAWIKIDC